MVVLDQFYQIVEAPTSRVSDLWKISQTLTFIVSALCSFTTGFSFGLVLDSFNYNCLLQSDIVFDNFTFFNITKDGHIYHRRLIDVTMTSWGPTSECNFAQFTPLFIMISAIIWGTFLIVLSKGGAGYTTDLLSRPWRFVYPCIFFSAILLIIKIVSTVRLKNGIEQFCQEFHEELNNTGCTPEINIYSRQFQDDNTNSYMFNEFYTNMVISTISSNIGIWSWVIQLILSITRVCCISDFDLQLVTIVSKDDEQVENIVELNEITAV